MCTPVSNRLIRYGSFNGRTDAERPEKAICHAQDNMLNRPRPARRPRGRQAFQSVMSSTFTFAVRTVDGDARLGEIVTPRGVIRTPAFMPVGTAATVKAMHPEAVRALGADIVLSNTYHLMLSPGAERIAALGGLHKFMNWPYPILTDSGGFQVMSLAKLRKLSEKGVTFQSHIDGSRHELTPERSMDIQRLLGSDIQMQFDECVRLPCAREEAERAMRLSLRWAERSKAAFGEQPGRAVFGIVQGGTEKDLRVASADALVDIGFTATPSGASRSANRRLMMLEMIETVVPHLAGRPAALPDGRRHAGRSAQVAPAGRRHVRLRHADPRRAARNGFHPSRPHESAQRPLRGRPASDRSRCRRRGWRGIIRARIGATSSNRAKSSP